MVTDERAGNDSAGIWYGVLAYTAWGVLPLYWKLLQAIPALEILAHRILWSYIFVRSLNQLALVNFHLCCEFKPSHSN